MTGDSGRASTTEADSESPPSGDGAQVGRPGVGRRILMSGVVFLALFLLIEGTCSVTLAVRKSMQLEPLREEAHSRYDGDLGWSHVPSRVLAEPYGKGTTLTINAQGFRADHDFAQQTPTDKFRVLCLGDSFTLGWGVDDAAVYVAQMQSLEPRLETLNMGQGGYGLDQCYLWFKRDGLAYEADVLLFAFIPYDFPRMGKVEFQGYPRPFLEVEDGALVARNTPVPETYDSAHTFRRLGAFTSELALTRMAIRGAKSLSRGSGQAAVDPFAFDRDVARALFDDLRGLCAAKKRPFVLVYFPLKGLLPVEPTSPNTWMREYAEATGTPYIDLTDTFAALSPRDLAAAYLPDEHFTAAGHERVAHELLRRLREIVPEFPR